MYGTQISLRLTHNFYHWHDQRRAFYQFAAPLHLIGYRGAEKKILDELYDPLLKQGFSENCCGYIGWIVGELCDNAHTHSEGQCYLIAEAIQSSITEKRYLCIAIGDTGIGIPTSFKKNAKYIEIPNNTLLPMAFLCQRLKHLIVSPIFLSSSLVTFRSTKS